MEFWWDFRYDIFMCCSRSVLHFLLSFVFCALPFFQAFATDVPYIAVGTAKTRKSTLAVPDFRSHGALASPLAKKAQSTLVNDLAFMDIFSFIKPAAFIEKPDQTGIVSGSFKFTDWSSIGAELLIKTAVSVDDKKKVILEGYLYNPQEGKQLLGKKYVGDINDITTLAHSYANDIVTTLTGLPGIFLTKIAMTCDITKKKEIYVMNFDGSEAKQVTHHRSIAFAPAWNPEGNRIAYSLFTRRKNIKNIDLYEFDLTSHTVRLLSSRKGINSGASYSPDGTEIALTLSFSGNPEIFSLNAKNGSVRKLTKSFGFDVDPSWSPDGQSLAFVSSRAGLPMIFTMKADGSQVERLTFAGRYNASPHWSPRNHKIVFAGWLDRAFDIFTINPDGTHIERLSKNQGSNEDPFFSPDGNFIVFSSNRTGQKNIYVMNGDGSFVKRLTYGLGNCVSPRWSNPPRLGETYSQQPS